MSTSNTESPKLSMFILFGVVITGYLLFVAGLDAAHRHFAAMIGNVILALFVFAWTSICVSEHINRVTKRATADAVNKITNDAKQKLDKIFTKAKEVAGPMVLGVESAHDDQLARILVETIKEVTGNDDGPQEEQLAEIKRRFIKKTGHGVHIELDIHNDLEVRISRQPLSKTERRKVDVKGDNETTSSPTVSNQKASGGSVNGMTSEKRNPQTKAKK